MDKLKKIFKHGDKDTEQDEGPHAPSPHAERAAKTALADAYGSPGGSASTDAPVHLQTNPDAAQHEHGIMSQITNPGGDKYDSTRFGETATAVPGTTLSRLQDVGGGGSNMSVLSGVVGPYASDADKGLPAATSSSAIATDTSSTSHAAESTANPTLSSVQPGTSGSDWPLTGSSTGSTQPQGETLRLGRDAAVGGAAATGLGAAGYAAGHDRDATSLSNTGALGQQTGATSSTAGGLGPMGETSSYAGPETGSLAGGRVKPDSSIATGDSSNLGRDAAVGTGVGATALGAGALTSNTKEQERSFPLGGGATQTSSAGPMAGDTTAPTSALGAGSGMTHSQTTGPISSDSPSTVRELADKEVGTSSSSHHLGRDAALAGGAGVVGGGALAAFEKEHEPKADIAAATYTARSHPVGGTSTTAIDEGRGFLPSESQSVSPLGGHHDNEKPFEGYVHHTHGPHATDIANTLDPHVPGEFPTEEGEDRHGRNGAGAAYGATGLTGAAASMAAVAPPTQRSAETTSSLPEAPPSPSTGRHPSELMGMPAERGVVQPESDSHAIRHASISAGTVGVGAAGLGAAAYEANKRDQPSKIGFSSGSTPTDFTSRPVEPASTSSARRPSQIARSAAAPAAVPAATSTTTQQQGPPHPSELMSRPIEEDSHTGRNAALGAGAGLGAAGLGATGYDAYKSHEAAATGAQPSLTSSTGQFSALSGGQPSTSTSSQPPISGSQSSGTALVQPTTTYAGHPSASTASQPSTTQTSALPSSAQQPVTSESHTGRDAALGAGAGVGAAGLGAAGYEAYKYHQEPASSSIPSQSQASYGSVPQSSGAQYGDQEPLIKTTTNHRLSQSSGSPMPGSAAQTGSVGENQKQHHYGRDAAVAGGVGAGGVGAYELAKHEKDKDSALPATSSTSSAQPLSQTGDKEHHYGRDAAIAGGAGTAGVGAYELAKHEKGKDATSTTPPDESSDHHHREHNKLHKRTDPRSDKYVAPEEEEKKPSLLSRILHPHSSKDKENQKDSALSPDTDTPTSRTSEGNDHYRSGAPAVAGAAGAAGASELSSSEHQHAQSNDGVMIEPHTGLPMNVGKYGTEAVEHRIGTDGAIGDESQVSGMVHAQPGDPGVVVEKHTGLPMNVGKYGSGAGGTDGGHMEGHVGEPSAATGIPGAAPKLGI